MMKEDIFVVLFVVKYYLRFIIKFTIYAIVNHKITYVHINKKKRN